MVVNMDNKNALQGRVKSILSGDTVIVTNPKGLERTLSLAYISAPRLKREGDEVCQMYTVRCCKLTFTGLCLSIPRIYSRASLGKSHPIQDSLRHTYYQARIRANHSPRLQGTA